jgi:phosphatidate cytidylyltransferase
VTIGNSSPGPPPTEPAPALRDPLPSSAEPRRAVVGTFVSRTVFAGLITAAFAVLAWADWTGLGGGQPAWWLLPAAVVLAVGGVDELGQLFATRQIVLPVWLLRLAVVAMVLAAAAGAGAFASTPSAASPMDAMGWTALTAVFTILALCSVEIATYRSQAGAIDRLTGGVFVIAFLGLPLACIVGLRLLSVGSSGPDQAGRVSLGMLPLVSLVAVAKAGDIAAYLGGTLLGRHRMTPNVSPGKTWEGAAASLLGSSAMAWGVLEYFGGPTIARPWGGWFVFGICVGLAAMVGDLAESLLKRECGAKDSGRWLGGLGGVLDLLDSLLFAAPVAWLLWVLGGR